MDLTIHGNYASLPFILRFKFEFSFLFLTYSPTPIANFLINKQKFGKQFFTYGDLSTHNFLSIGQLVLLLDDFIHFFLIVFQWRGIIWQKIELDLEN